MLRLCLLMNLLLFSLSAFAQDKDEAGRKELIKLQGEWKMLSGQSAGEMMPANMVAGFSMMVRDNQYEFRNSEETEKGSMVLTPTTKPAQIDIFINDGSFKGQKQLGIYELNDKKVKFCLAIPGEMKRPEKFESNAQNQNLLFEFEQVKK